MTLMSVTPGVQTGTHPDHGGALKGVFIAHRQVVVERRSSRLTHFGSGLRRGRHPGSSAIRKAKRESYIRLISRLVLDAAYLQHRAVDYVLDNHRRRRGQC